MKGRLVGICEGAKMADLPGQAVLTWAAEVVGAAVLEVVTLHVERPRFGLIPTSDGRGRGVHGPCLEGAGSGLDRPTDGRNERAGATAGGGIRPGGAIFGRS